MPWEVLKQGHWKSMPLEGVHRKNFWAKGNVCRKGAARVSKKFCSNAQSRTMVQTPHGFKRMLHSHMLHKCSKKTFIRPQHRRERGSAAASPTHARRQVGTYRGNSAGLSKEHAGWLSLVGNAEIKQKEKIILCALISHYFLFLPEAESV